MAGSLCFSGVSRRCPMCGDKFDANCGAKITSLTDKIATAECCSMECAEDQLEELRARFES